MLMARRICVRGYELDRSAECFNKTRPSALQVNEHYENEQTARKFHDN